MSPTFRVAIRSPNWLGDVVMALPAIRAVRRHDRSATLSVVAPAALAPLFSLVADIDDVVALPGPAPHASALERAKAEARVLRAGGFDRILLLPNSFRTAWAAWQAAVPERWGYRSGARRWLLTKAISRRAVRPPGRRHHAGYSLDLVRACGIEPVPYEPQIAVDGRLEGAADRLLADIGVGTGSPLIGIAPGAAYGPAKRWPAERYAHLIVRATRELGAACVLIGTQGDSDVAREIESFVSSTEAGNPGEPPPGRVVNLVGRTNLVDLVGVLARCRVVLSNDSGAMHLAAAAGVPVVAVFGPTDEHATSPLGRHEVLINPVWCRPCLLRRCPIDHRCMTGISPDAVFAAVARFFGEAGDFPARGAGPCG